MLALFYKMFKKNKQIRKQNKRNNPEKKYHFMVINKLILRKNFVFNFIVILGK